MASWCILLSVATECSQALPCSVRASNQIAFSETQAAPAALQPENAMTAASTIKEQVSMLLQSLMSDLVSKPCITLVSVLSNSSLGFVANT